MGQSMSFSSSPKLLSNTQKQSSDQFYLYTNSDCIGSIESNMNTMIFRPPTVRQHADNVKNVENFGEAGVTPPDWIKFLYYEDQANSTKKRISYSIIHPEKVNPDSKYILFSHGNASDLFTLRDYLISIYENMGKTVGVVGYDYEGYGLSSGTCSEKNCYNNLALMVAHLTKQIKINKNNLILIGQSLGTGVVVDFCYTHKWISPIVLISPYKSISRVMFDPHKYDIISNSLIESIDMFTTHHKVNDLLCRIFIYHGLKDNLIIPDHSIAMRNRHSDKITLELIKDANHNNILGKIDMKTVISKIQ